MIRNGKSCMQNKEKHQGLGPNPKEGHQAECGATSLCGIFPLSFLLLWIQCLVFLRICMLKCNPTHEKARK